MLMDADGLATEKNAQKTNQNQQILPNWLHAMSMRFPKTVFHPWFQKAIGIATGPKSIHASDRLELPSSSCSFLVKSKPSVTSFLEIISKKTYSSNIHG